jgi:hypothetical protein
MTWLKLPDTEAGTFKISLLEQYEFATWKYEVHPAEGSSLGLTRRHIRCLRQPGEFPTFFSSACIECLGWLRFAIGSTCAGCSSVVPALPDSESYFGCARVCRMTSQRACQDQITTRVTLQLSQGPRLTSRSNALKEQGKAPLDHHRWLI